MTQPRPTTSPTPVAWAACAAKRERTVAVAYDFSGLGSVDAIRRLYEIAATDALGLETSIPKIRAVTAVASATARLLEIEELETRVAPLATALGARADGLAEPPPPQGRK